MQHRGPAEQTPENYGENKPRPHLGRLLISRAQAEIQPNYGRTRKDWIGTAPRSAQIRQAPTESGLQRQKQNQVVEGKGNPFVGATHQHETRSPSTPRWISTPPRLGRGRANRRRGGWLAGGPAGGPGGGFGSRRGVRPREKRGGAALDGGVDSGEARCGLGETGERREGSWARVLLLVEVEVEVR